VEKVNIDRSDFKCYYLIEYMSVLYMCQGDPEKVVIDWENLRKTFSLRTQTQYTVIRFVSIGTTVGICIVLGLMRHMLKLKYTHIKVHKH